MIRTYFLLACLTLSSLYTMAWQTEFQVREKKPVKIEGILSKLVDGKPEEVGIDAATLDAGIQSIIQQALDSGAFPGCQILIAKDGVVF